MTMTREVLDRWLKKSLSRLPSVRRRKVEEFVKEMKLAGLSPWTIKSHVQAILTLGLDGKPYEELTPKDVEEWLQSIDHHKPETISSYRRRVKRFLRWLHRVPPHAEPPEVVKMIKVGKSRRSMPREILTHEEVQRLIAASRSIRNRALIHVAYESGCRPGEVLGLRIRDVEFDRKGAVIIVSGKTGPRRIRLVQSIVDLQRWLAVHPHRNNPDAWLWPGRRGEHVSPEYFNSILKRCAESAGISKRIHPYLLRHTRATHLANILTEDQLRVFFGWSRESRIPARYVHLSGRDVDEAILRHYGLARTHERRSCPRCGFLAESGYAYCPRCSAILSEIESVRVEERRALEERVLEKLVRKLIEIAPDVLERALVESGSVEEIVGEIEAVCYGPAGEI